MTIPWPEGPAWFFLVLAVVIIVAPLAAERVGLPGIIGLLAAGFLIGPNALDAVHSTDSLQGLGQVGLLYLMALAGLELDLNVFAARRTQALVFGALTFSAPFLLGLGAALILGYGTLAAILIGSLWASHTLLAYPTVRRFGLPSNPAVAIAVGATVITDTVSLLVLAVVAGLATQSMGALRISDRVAALPPGGADPLATVIQIVGLGLGLLVLMGYCFLFLPKLASWFFSGVGQERTLRFLFVFAGFLSGAVLAEIVGIEGLVGAFFAGLALNRFVPNRGALMERVEFVGSALFIPVFMISVGLLIDLRVLANLHTLALAAVFLACVVGGKAIAAIVAGRLDHFSRAEVGVMFSLTVAQAAATLAATTVGYDVGLFGDDVVNAVVVVIAVSLLITSTTAVRFASRVPRPSGSEYRLGSAVVVPIDDVAPAETLARLAMRIAMADAGVVVPVHVAPDGISAEDLAVARRTSVEIDDAVRHAGVDAETSLVVARSIVAGIRNTTVRIDGSLLVMDRGRSAAAQTILFGGLVDEIVSSSSVPVVVADMAEAPIERVLVPVRAADLTPERRPDLLLAMEIAVRLAKGSVDLVVGLPDPGSPPDIEMPDDANVVALGGSRTAWARATAAAGDLVLLPGELGRRTFGMDAARLVGTAGVSVAVVVGAYRSGAFVTGEEANAQVVATLG